MLHRIRGKSGSIFTQVIFGLIIIAFVFLGVGRFSGFATNVVATVNGEEILQKDFADLAYRIFQQESRNDADLLASTERQDMLKGQILENMIMEKLQKQEADKLGLFVSPEELYGAIATISAFHNEKGAFDVTAYQQVLRNAGRTPADFEKDVSNDLLLKKLQASIALTVDITEEEAKQFYMFMMEERIAEYVLFARESYESQVKPSDAQIQGYYDTHKVRFQEPARMDLEYIAVTPRTLAAGFTATEQEIADFYEKNANLFTVPAEVKVRHILLRAPAEGTVGAGSEEAVQNAQATARSIQEELKKGADFAVLAQKYSEDPGSASAGGDLGWHALGGGLVAPFEEAAFRLKPGEISDIVRTEFGLHLIKVDDKKVASKKALQDVSERIKEEITINKALQEEDRLRKEIVAELENGTDFTAIADKFGLKLQKTGVIAKEDARTLLQLHSDALPVLENIPVGEASPIPLNIVDGVALVKVLSSTPERLPALEEVKEKIRALLIGQESAALAKAAADKELTTITGATVPSNLKSKLQTSQAFSRAMPLVMPLGNVPGLADALNELSAGQWAGQSFATSDGAVIARVSKVIPATEESWKTQGGMIYSALYQNRMRETAEAYMRQLFLQSKVTLDEENIKAVRFQ